MVTNEQVNAVLALAWKDSKLLEKESMVSISRRKRAG